jgi:hypothetical protein
MRGWGALAVTLFATLCALAGHAAAGVPQSSVADNGKPVNGQPVDRVATEPPQPPGVFDAAAGVCTDPSLNPAWNRIETGDFTVRDAG